MLISPLSKLSTLFILLEIVVRVRALPLCRAHPRKVLAVLGMGCDRKRPHLQLDGNHWGFPVRRSVTIGFDWHVAGDDASSRSERGVVVKK